MTLLRRAFRSVWRRKLRTLLVSFVLALCVAVLISTIAGVRASEESTQEMVAGVETSTAEMVAKVEARTAEMVAGVEAATEEIVAGVEQGAGETIELTEIMSRMIMVSGGFSPMGGGMGGSIGGGMSEDVVDDIYSIEGVAAVVPRLTQRVGGSVPEPGDGKMGESGDYRRMMGYDYVVNGVPLDPSLVEEYPVLPSYIIAGRQITEGDDAAVLLLNQDLTTDEESTFYGAGVGDTITLEGSEFEVVGIFYSTQFGDQKAIYMSLENAQNLFSKQGTVSQLQVFAETESVVDDVAAGIEELASTLDQRWFVRTMEDIGMGRFGESIALTQEEQVARIQEQASLQIATIQENAAAQTATIQEDVDLQIAALQEDLGNIESLGVQISFVAGIAGVLIIFGIMFYTVRERTREIGVLKALGFSNPYIMKRFMLEGSYIGFLGGLIGVALGAVTCSLLGPWLLDISEATSVTLEPYYLLIGLGAAVLSGAFGSVYPAWQASRVSPMEALRHG